MNKCTVSVNPFPPKLPYQSVCECCFSQPISFHTSLPPFVSSITVVLPSTTFYICLYHILWIFYLHQLSHFSVSFVSGHQCCFFLHHLLFLSTTFCVKASKLFFAPPSSSLLYHLLCQGINVFCTTIFHTSLPPFVLGHGCCFLLHHLPHFSTTFCVLALKLFFAPPSSTFLYHILCQGINVFCSIIFQTSLPPLVSGQWCFLLHHLPHFSTHLYKSVVPFTGTPAGHQWSDATHTQRTEIVPAKDRKISAKFCETKHIYRPKLWLTAMAD